MQRVGNPVNGDWRSMSSGANNRVSTARNRHPVRGHGAPNYDDQSPHSMVPRSLLQRLDEIRGAYDPWRLFDERVRTAPYGLTSFPYQPHPSIRILVLSDRDAERVRPNLAESVRDTPPSARGQRRATESGGLSRDELKKVMSMMRKQIFSPTYPRKRAWKRGLFSRHDSDSRADSKEEDVDDDAGTECAICLEAFQPNEQVLATPCNHMFHHDCLVPWVKSNGKCPVCRFVFYERRDAIAPNTNNSNRNRSTELMDENLIALIRAMEVE